MRLYLVQHGDNTSDPGKPLSPKGREDVADLARSCKAYGVSATEVFHSGKLRAEQSAEILSDALGIPAKASAGLDPLDPVALFASTCEGWEEDRIVVGHLPFLERLAALLVAGREEPPVVAFKRGGMACLEKRDRAWCILWTLMPDQPKGGTARTSRSAGGPKVKGI